MFFFTSSSNSSSSRFDRPRYPYFSRSPFTDRTSLCYSSEI